MEEPAASSAELEPIRQELGRIRADREQLRREVAGAIRAAEQASGNDRVFQWAFGILGAGVLLQGVELIRLKRRK